MNQKFGPFSETINLDENGISTVCKLFCLRQQNRVFFQYVSMWWRIFEWDAGTAERTHTHTFTQKIITIPFAFILATCIYMLSFCVTHTDKIPGISICFRCQSPSVYFAIFSLVFFFISLLALLLRDKRLCLIAHSKQFFDLLLFLLLLFRHHVVNAYKKLVTKRQKKRFLYFFLSVTKFIRLWNVCVCIRARAIAGAGLWKYSVYQWGVLLL